MYIYLKILSTYQQCQIPALNLLLKATCCICFVVGN